MSSERLEEVTLINDSSYLHLKENDSGFQYALFDKESRDKVCDGQFDWTEPDTMLFQILELKQKRSPEYRWIFWNRLWMNRWRGKSVKTII